MAFGLTILDLSNGPRGLKMLCGVCGGYLATKIQGCTEIFYRFAYGTSLIFFGFLVNMVLLIAELLVIADVSQMF